MKKSNQIKVGLIICLIILSYLNVNGQVSVSWPLTDPASDGTGLSAVISGPLSAYDELLFNTEINHYDGPNNSQRIRILGNEWPANQTTQIDTVYIQFSVSPKSGFEFNINSVSLGIAGVSINTMKANIYYSTDPDFNNLTQITYTTPDAGGNNYLNRDSLTLVTASPNVKINSDEAFYLRIYPWVDNDPAVRTGKYVALQNVIIGGNVEGIPVPGSVTYPLQTDENPVTTGNVLAKPQSYSPAMKLYNFTQLPTTEGYTVKCASIQTVVQTWTAETDPVDSLYFQYEISPKFGGTYITDSVSLFIGGWFTNNLRAAFYFSKDSAFANKSLLISDTALVGNALKRMKAELKETVNSGETLYLRVYPHNTNAEGWAKLVVVDSVIITGTTTGVSADPPSISTIKPFNISTKFATSGGNITTDGGASVTARGVCWNLTGLPTTSDNKTNDGTGVGTFTSQVTDLEPGRSYYLRAYAINDAGIAYGNEESFKTLDSAVVPEVTTASVTDILVKTAQSGGNVKSWGGDSVKARGVCWNSTGNPTIADTKTINGSGLGSFISILYPLTENTKYYARAYATNSIGTGYGLVDTFTTQTKSSAVTKIVAKDGSGDFTTIQEAFNSVPELYTGPYTIFIKKGIYYEKLTLSANKSNVILIGEDPDSTILTYDDYAGKAGGTSQCQSVAIDASDFTAMNITFQNTIKNDGSFNDQQAVALRVNGDRQSYYNCRLIGYQDTYYTWGGAGTGRIYMKDCYIGGSVDFIFGRDIVVFDSCHININRDGGTLTAASTNADSKFGYVFLNCMLTNDSIGFNGNPISKYYLGRPWQSAPRTVFINCYESGKLDPAGWQSWNVNPALYAEYNCFGPGYNSSKRVSWSFQLTNNQAADYTLSNIFSLNSNPRFGYDWMPEKPVITSVKDGNLKKEFPKTLELNQNYPNPFNPTTTIKYSIPNAGIVKILVYDTIGRLVAKLTDKFQEAGYYSINFNASPLSSGIYFYQIRLENSIITKKMILLK